MTLGPVPVDVFGSDLNMPVFSDLMSSSLTSSDAIFNSDDGDFGTKNGFDK